MGKDSKKAGKSTYPLSQKIGDETKCRNSLGLEYKNKDKFIL